MLGEFQKAEKKSLRRIAAATESKDLDSIIRWTRVAQSCQDAQSKLKELGALLEALSAELNLGQLPQNERIPSPTNLGRDKTKPTGISANPKQDRISPKAKGKQMRNDFLGRLKSKGIPLHQHKGVIYQKAGSQQLVGIASATERQPDKWFLGLPERQYSVVVLLCEDQTGQIYDFILPEKDLANIWSLLSRSNDQVKLHIERSGENFTLRIPGGGFRTVDRSLYASLR